MDQGFCATLSCVVCADGENKIGDARRIQNNALDASCQFVDPVFGASAARSVLLSFPGIERDR